MFLDTTLTLQIPSWLTFIAVRSYLLNDHDF